MLDDKYRIERLLAAGGMGAVYLGTHIKLRKRVAIKVLNPELSTAPMVERFHREAITASQIGHEGIAQVTDIGTSSEGEPFLVMEYLEGESLARRLADRGPLAVADACELGCSILSPLSAAHRAGIIHRDLKPDNVFLVRQSRGEMVKLLDFGISRTAGLEPTFRLTMTGLVLGTPYYMSPEQARGESQITPAADLYAFGVMLYEMLIGEVPIRADNYNALMYRVTIGDFAPPRERRPDLPREIERIILHAMAQAPEDRPASAATLEGALLAFCRPVFREHASGRISAPALAMRSSVIGPRGGDAADPARFGGPTVSGPELCDAPAPVGDTLQDPVLAAVTAYDDLDPDAALDDVDEHDALDRRETLEQYAVLYERDALDEHSALDNHHALDNRHALDHHRALEEHDALDNYHALAHHRAPTARPVLSGGPASSEAPSLAEPPRRARSARLLTGLAIVVGGAVAAGSLMSALAGRDRATPDRELAPGHSTSWTISEPPTTRMVVPAPASRDTAQTVPDRPDDVGTAQAVADRPDDVGIAQAAPDQPGDAAPVGPRTTITLRFAIQPPGAAITLDGKRITGTELAVAKDAVPHRLRITAAGYLGHDEIVSFDESQRLVVQLMHTAGTTHGIAPPKEGSGVERTQRIESKSPYE